MSIEDVNRACRKSLRYVTYKAAEGRCIGILRSEANEVDGVAEASTKNDSFIFLSTRDLFKYMKNLALAEKLLSKKYFKLGLIQDYYFIERFSVF